MAEKFYLTTPIYYVNAKPHIGSAYTTIAADVLARYYRTVQRADVHLLTGTAEHGTKMAQYAAAENKTPQEFVDTNSAHFKSAWEKLNISYDDFIRTTELRHREAVTQFFLKLKDSGKIYEGEYEGLYCVGHEAFIKESELDAQGLCPDHKKAPEKVREHNWFFKLTEYTDELTRLIKSGEMEIAPAAMKKAVLSFIEHGLEDISISRQNVSWAIPLPWDEQQTIYVWLDELFNYCSAIGYGKDQAQFKRYWPADLHLIGKDIIKFHAIIWPALLLAIGEQPPRKIFAHGYFTVDGQKMSKSLGNVVDPVAVTEEYGADALRYFILRDIPFGNDGDFSHERLKERYNADLANGLGNLVSRVLTMIQQFYADFDSSEIIIKSFHDRRVGNDKIWDEMLPAEVSTALLSVDELIERMNFDKALSDLWHTISLADEVIERTKPWQLYKEEKPEKVKKILQDLYCTLLAINQFIAPFMPFTHTKITALLSARPLKKPTEPLFARKQ